VPLLAAADVVALAVALAAAAAVAVAVEGTAVTAPAPLLAALAAGLLAAWLGVLAAYGLYDGPSRTLTPGAAGEPSRLFQALLAGSLLLLLAGEAASALGAPRVATPLQAAVFIATALAAVPAGRALVRATLLPRLVRPRRALVVGAGRVGRRLAQELAAHPAWGLEVAGFVDDDPVDVGPGPVLGRTADLTRIVEEHDIAWVLVASSRAPGASLLEAVRAARRPDVRLAVVPDSFALLGSGAATEDLGGLPVVSLPPLRLSRPARAGKRAFDVVVAAVGLVLLAPSLAARALAARRDGRPPLWSVLRGDMSLVGPRPSAVGEPAPMPGRAERRLDAKPGVTGSWRVAERTDLTADELVKLDVAYVTRWSLWRDAEILLRTVPTVLRRRGARRAAIRP
jgi:hypothetical protein